MKKPSKTSNLERVSIAGLKARLSEYLARARAGEEVVITDRGRPVAKLGPLSGQSAMEGRTSALIRAGLLRAPTQRLDRKWFEAPRPRDPSGRGVQAVLEERSESW